MSELTQKVYHEKQRRQLCLLHTLNNLFQREEFTQNELDAICESFDDRRWLNSHRSWLGLGNYDANVLLAAIGLRNLATVWFDFRCSAKQINFDVVTGYIFNVSSTNFVPFYKGRHWFAVLKIGSLFYNLDSKLPEAIVIDDFVMFANRLLSAENQLLLVTTRENEKNCIIKPPT